MAIRMVGIILSLLLGFLIPVLMNISFVHGGSAGAISKTLQRVINLVSAFDLHNDRIGWESGVSLDFREIQFNTNVGINSDIIVSGSDESRVKEFKKGVTSNWYTVSSDEAKDGVEITIERKSDSCTQTFFFKALSSHKVRVLLFKDVVEWWYLEFKRRGDGLHPPMLTGKEEIKTRSSNWDCVKTGGVFSLQSLWRIEQSYASKSYIYADSDGWLRCDGTENQKGAFKRHGAYWYYYGSPCKDNINGCIVCGTVDYAYTYWRMFNDENKIDSHGDNKLDTKKKYSCQRFTEYESGKINWLESDGTLSNYHARCSDGKWIYESNGYKDRKLFYYLPV